MKWQHWIEKWGLTGLSLNAGFLNMEWAPQDPDRAAAWELYVELLTRTATQHLQPEHGDEKRALESIFELFSLTRETLKQHGRFCGEFAKIAIVVLNQVIRPFTAKWHRLSLAGPLRTRRGAASFDRSWPNCNTCCAVTPRCLPTWRESRT